MTKNDEERSDRSRYGAGTERDRSWCVRALAIARPFLPAAAAFSIDQEIYGRLRDARRSPARSDRRVGRADAARPAGAPLQIGIHENP
jgi:hypothetical protein